MISWFAQLRITDVDTVGGKNASLGEMLSNLSAASIRVPDGFATTANAFRIFLRHEHLDHKIYRLLEQLNVEDIVQLQQRGNEIRRLILSHPLPSSLEQAITEAYTQLTHAGTQAVAVRSSATAEDLPEASFAGQQETFLNVSGIDNVLHCIRKVFASLFTDRAIAYRVHQGFDPCRSGLVCRGPANGPQ